MRAALSAATVYVLLLAGVLEAGAMAWSLRRQPELAASLNAPAALLGFTLAVAVASSRHTRLAAAVGALLALSLRLACVGLALLARRGYPLGGWLTTGAGVVTGVAVLSWALVSLMRGTEPVAGPAQTQASPEYPVPAHDQWARASTPWPRADEADPDGTLIRPRRR